MANENMAIEITEDFIRYRDGTIQRPPIGCKFCIDDIKKIMEAGENYREKEDKT